MGYESRRDGDGGVKKKKEKKQPSMFMPVIMGIALVTMLVVFLIKRGRSSRGSCQWDSANRKATCQGKLLSVLPDDINEAVITLHMGTQLDKSENMLTELKKENFTRYPMLAELSLIKCGIEEIHASAFSELPALRRLDLRHNRIQVLNEHTFRGVRTLEYLYLSNNPITALTDYTFRGLTINKLHLENNPALTEISSRAFSGSSIDELCLNRCSLSSLHVDTFDPLEESLDRLEITHNMQPLKLTDGIFDGLKLDELILDGNGFTTTDFFSGLQAKEIELDDNNFDEFECDKCEGLKDTVRLSLTRCGLDRLEADDFDDFDNLEELDLEGNDLVTISTEIFEDLPHLRILDLADNDLEGFA